MRASKPQLPPAGLHQLAHSTRHMAASASPDDAKDLSFSQDLSLAALFGIEGERTPRMFKVTPTPPCIYHSWFSI